MVGEAEPLDDTTRNVSGHAHQRDKPDLLCQSGAATAPQSRDQSYRQHVLLLPFRASCSKGCNESFVKAMLMRLGQIGYAPACSVSRE